jgi:hypothetical protein
MSKWTQFWDMHSGGSQKEDFARCYIEAPEAEAKVIFYNRFGHNPDRVTCTCCGEDYSITEAETLEQASGYHRNCQCVDNQYIEEPCTESYRQPYLTVEQYAKLDEVCIIRADEIADDERIGDVPNQGFVWVD